MKLLNDSNLTSFNISDPDLIHKQIVPMIPFVEKASNISIPNVLLLAIDTTSYVNFRRNFNRTHKFIKQNNFYELRGYNKVGQNTFPNMIPYLTGYKPEELVSIDKLREIFFDDWPLIWKKYSEKGFITTFLEEMPLYGLFHYELKGFKNEPTNYFLRPFHREIYNEKYNRFCYVEKTELEVKISLYVNWLNVN